MRFFNTAGPVRPERNYCIPPLERVALGEVRPLIEQEKYFVLHAPRQTGKTSALLALMAHLNAEGRYACVYVNVEGGQAFADDVEAGVRTVVDEVASGAKLHLGDDFPAEVVRTVLPGLGPGSTLRELLSRWAEHTDRPIVLLLDEIDALSGRTLVTVLRQLRAGYAQRPGHFPSSVVLCGVRDVRDYRLGSDADGGKLGGSSFNIMAKSLRLGDFTRAEVLGLLGQHETETGQRFEPAALEALWRSTEGQPWLVNALAYEACFELPEGRDRARAVDEALVGRAKERLIMRRVTHLDQLANVLKEERIRRVVEPILSGVGDREAVSRDDLDYAVDLGLVKVEGGRVRIANPIYREVVPRELTNDTQLYLPLERPPHVRADGSLDVPKLLQDFQAFFRKESEQWRQRFQYQEAWPHLLLQAWLAKVVNGGGSLTREFAVGSGRVDLCVEWPGEARPGRARQSAVIEVKLVREQDSTDSVVEQGVAQTARYAARCPGAEAHLVVIDRRADVAWDRKCFRRDEASEDGRVVTVWGM